MTRKQIKEEIRQIFIDFVDPALVGKIDEDDLFASGHIEGDDADEFLEAFIDAFAVDMSTFEPWFHYIADEPPSMFGRRIVPLDTDGNAIPIKPVSLDDLAKAAEVGLWSFEYPKFRYKSVLWNHLLQYGLIVFVALWIVASIFL